jgi:hypothetical protein
MKTVPEVYFTVFLPRRAALGGESCLALLLTSCVRLGTILKLGGIWGPTLGPTRVMAECEYISKGVIII